ncbi:MAG: hypothetical protein ACK559_17175 [bacterium]
MEPAGQPAEPDDHRPIANPEIGVPLDAGFDRIVMVVDELLGAGDGEE